MNLERALSRPVVVGSDIRPTACSDVRSTAELVAIDGDTFRLLAGWENGPFAHHAFLLEPIRVSTKARVYRVRMPDREAVIVKIHSDDVAFATEMFALELFGAAEGSSCPAVRDSDDDQWIIVMEDIAQELDATSIEELARAAYALGLTHSVTVANQPMLRGCFPDATISELWARLDLFAFAANPAATRELVQLAGVMFGGDYVPVAIGDLKLGHARCRRDGSVALVDLGGFTPGMLEIFDVLSLLNLATSDLRVDHAGWGTLLRAYLTGRDGIEPEAERIGNFHGLLQVAASSIGLSKSFFS